MDYALWVDHVSNESPYKKIFEKVSQEVRKVMRGVDDFPQTAFLVPKGYGSGEASDVLRLYLYSFFSYICNENESQSQIFFPFFLKTGNRANAHIFSVLRTCRGFSYKRGLRYQYLYFFPKEAFEAGIYLHLHGQTSTEPCVYDGTKTLWFPGFSEDTPLDSGAGFFMARPSPELLLRMIGL